VSDLLTQRVIGCAIEVHRSIGPGLLEAVYQECLVAELSSNGLAVREQVFVPIHYKGRVLASRLRLDLLIENVLVVEVKTTTRNLKLSESQLLSYLRLTGFKIGLILNFNVPLMKHGIRRLRT